MESYDIAIIGTGPAGLEAAITAKVRNKKIILIGKDSLSPKIEKAHVIKNYLGLPDISGGQMREALHKHLEQMKITITEDRANTVYAMGKYFAIQGHKQMYEAQTVILACGIELLKPLPGELDNLGKGVSYCATCDGMLYKGKTVAVIGYSKEDENEAEFLSELAEEVIYIPVYNETDILNRKIRIIENDFPVSIEKQESRFILKLKNDSINADGIFILRENVAPEQLVPGLKMEKNHVAVNRNMETNIPGLFACGDVTGTPYQYIKAAGEGNVAALSAVNYLTKVRNVCKAE